MRAELLAHKGRVLGTSDSMRDSSDFSMTVITIIEKSVAIDNVSVMQIFRSAKFG